MDNKDIRLNDKNYEKLLHDNSYYQTIFKKTEKIVSVVFYILNNVEVEKKSETHSSNLASKAHFAHENALRSLEAKPASAKEVLEQFAQSLIGLDSTLRVTAVANVVPPEALSLLLQEISIVLKNVSQYIGTDSALERMLQPETSPAPATTRRPSQRVKRTVSTPTETPVQAERSSDIHDRRTRISTILEAKGEASIKDIAEIVSDVSEKTIQRELNAMIEDNIVMREGERRWSKYRLATTN